MSDQLSTIIFSSSTVNYGDTITGTITSYVTGCSHKLTLKCEESLVDIDIISGQSYVSFTPPSNWLNQLPYDTKATITANLFTIDSNSKVLGSTISLLIFNIPEAIKPIITSIAVTAYNTNEWINTLDIYVAGYTKGNVNIDAMAGQGSIIDYFILSGNGFEIPVKTVDPQLLSTILTTVGTSTITVTVYDKRGRYTSANSNQFEVISYAVPSVVYTYIRGIYENETWTQDDSGTWLKLSVIPTLTLTSYNNKCRVKFIVNNVIVDTQEDIISGTNIIYYISDIYDIPYLQSLVTDYVGNTVQNNIGTIPGTINVLVNDYVLNDIWKIHTHTINL